LAEFIEHFVSKSQLLNQGREEEEIDFGEYRVEVHVDQKTKNRYGNSFHTANLDEFAGVSGVVAPVSGAASANLAAGTSSKAVKK
jgi:hypothetical protein